MKGFNILIDFFFGIFLCFGQPDAGLLTGKRTINTTYYGILRSLVTPENDVVINSLTLVEKLALRIKSTIPPKA